MPCSGTDKVPIDDARLVHINAAKLGDIQRAFGDGCQGATLEHARRRQDLDSVTDDAYGLLGLEEMPGDPQQVLIVAELLGRTAPAQEQPEILRRVNVAKCNLGLEVVGGLLAGDVPGNRPLRWDFVA